jgi:large subunit ribosomal protein L24
MKLKVGDKVLVTAGKDKGKKGEIVRVILDRDRVLVKGVNIYTKHVKPMGDKKGEKIERERSLPTANVAILNDKNQPDRIGYKVLKDGKKERIYKKTGKAITEKVAKKK